ncbi:FadR/GntR family transcriptional regulator [Aureimonas leprariae]|nr:FadR/GntR family transcriptional regulator [Aureimonas leprariae]
MTAASMGEAKNRTMALAVEFGRRITSGEWPVGAVLPTEGDIQASYGVSRTVVREAMRHLSAKGLIAVGPKVGTRVRPNIEWNMLDGDVLRWHLTAGVRRDFVEALYEMRLINEPEAARFAAARISPEKLDELAEALERMTMHPRGSAELVAADLDFHRIILEATGNPILRSLGTVIERSLAISFSLSWRQNPQAETVNQHARVLEAIQRGDGDAAALFMRQLIESACGDVVACLFPPDPSVEAADAPPSRHHMKLESADTTA